MLIRRSGRTAILNVTSVWVSRIIQRLDVGLMALNWRAYRRKGQWPRTVFLNRRAARGSPGICHFSFLSNFHE